VDVNDTRMMFYMRIPKTGSGTLADRLASAFAPEEVLFLEQDPRPWDRERLLSLRSTRRFVHAHVGRGGGPLSDMPDFDFLSTVREPVARLVSLYRRIRRQPSNAWNRAANALAPGAFFDHFADIFANSQSAYFALAFEALEPEILRNGPIRTLTSALPRVADRVRWLAPTELIDDFVMLWPIETGCTIPNRLVSRNFAPDDGDVSEAARAAILARPRLYDLDNVFWALAYEKFTAWRASVLDKATPWSHPANSRLAFLDGESGIWLRENWHDPALSGDVKQWWAGPGQASRVTFRRGANERFLHFEVDVVSGVAWADIQVVSSVTMKPLSLVHALTGADRVKIFVPLDSYGATGDILVVVPIVMAGIVSTANDNSLIRQSFVAQGWGLSQSGPERAMSRDELGHGANWVGP
jgi:hypothetical protein